MELQNHRGKFFAAGCVLLAGLLAGCGKQEAKAAPARPAAPVVVAPVVQRDVPIQVTAIGNVESYQTVQIRSLVNGQINGVFFKEGQDVHKGQMLFTLDKRPFQADLDKAIGTQKKDEAQALNSKAQAARFTALEKEGVMSHEQADAQRAQAQADASAVEADKAAVEAARVQLQYTEIRAPIDARTGAVMIHLGNLVKANDTPFLVQLNQITPIYVTFSVPENQLERVRQVAANHLKVLAYPKGDLNPVEGQLSFIDNGVDTQTGMIKLKGTFDNKDRRLWPGQFVDVALNLSMEKNALLVPSKAVQVGQQGSYVFIVTPQNTAESRAVKVAGAYQGNSIISDGLKPGERVVVDGQLRIVPNGNVVVQSTAPTTTTSAEAPTSAASGGGSQ